MTDRIATTDLVTAQLAADPAVFGGQGAELAQSGGRWVLTMTRELAHPPERVWPMLTEPGQLVRWSPVVPDRPLTSAGPALARENPADPAVDVTVLTCDPPRELVHRWGDHRLRWVLAPTAGGTRLTLEQTFDEGGQAALFGAGWHLCLAVLILVAGGQDVDRIVGERARDYGWAQLRDGYQASLG